MSKDMLGSVVRAAVGVPQGRMELLARIASDLAHDNARGEDWFAHYERVQKEGLPAPQFERNEHGHIVIKVTGIYLTGWEEIDRLIGAGLCISDEAKSYLTSMKGKKQGYDKCHQLYGDEYQLVILPGMKVEKDCTGEELRNYAAGFGYQKPLAGIIPRLLEAISKEMMEEMGFGYIAALHDPIIGPDGHAHVLIIRNCYDGLMLDAQPGSLDGSSRYADKNGFAFLVPVS
jgi:hypothetical protein